MSNLQIRLITAAFLIIISLGATWVGGTLFRAFILIVGAAIYHEWQDLTMTRKTPLTEMVGWFFYMGVAALILLDSSAVVIFTAILAAVIILGFLDRAFIGWRAGGLLYALAAPVTLSLIRNEPTGLELILFLYAVVWSTDSAAYFSGRALGGARLAPKLSPNKTWSGAIGGIMVALIVGPAVDLSMRPDLDRRLVPFLLILTFILSVVSQIGDIAESWLKRYFNAKDSGTLLPGHGGFMDRVDGLIAASVIFYLIILIIIYVP